MSFSDIIRVPFGYLLEFLYNITSNYGIALILFALVVKLILLPMGMKSKKSTMKMSRLSPYLKELERKYGSDQQKYQQEMMKFYKEEGVSPTGGCLWSFVPLLILLPLYHVIRMPLQYMMHLPAETAAEIVAALKELGLNLGKNNYYEQLVAASLLPEHIDQVRTMVPALQGVEIATINFEFLGVNLSQIPTWQFWTLTGWASIGLFLIPVISGFINWFGMWISQKQNNSVVTDENGEKTENTAASAAGTMKTMMYIMPFFSVYIGFTMPASISIYWIAQGLMGVVQDAILTSHFRKVYDAEDLIRKQRAAEQAAIEAERERIRAERRAKNPDGIVENTSKKKLKAREKAEHGTEIEGKLTPEERAALKEKKAESESGDSNRPWARGRAYIADRYGDTGEELVNCAEESVETAEAAKPAEEESRADADNE